MEICLSLLLSGMGLLLVGIVGRLVGVPLIWPRISFRRRRIVFDSRLTLKMTVLGTVLALLGCGTMVEVTAVSRYSREKADASTKNAVLCPDCVINDSSHVNTTAYLRASLFQPPVPINTMGFFPTNDIWGARIFEETTAGRGRVVIIPHDRY